MINLLLGAPGGGKSYEAVAFHVLPALRKGRKVITNLPLVIEQFAILDPSFPDLIEIRTQTKAEKPTQQITTLGYKLLGTTQFNRAAFANPEDYGDSWRHPETGAGPLYVIDECHIPLPRNGTPESVEIWFSLHRHETADVLLMTQSYGKINKAVADLVQVVYRVRKAVALGSQDRYIRKVQDGLRGEVVNQDVRKYEPKYFPLYKSHTRGGGVELSANDIKPFWRHWSVIGAAVFLLAGGVYLAKTLSDGVLPQPSEVPRPVRSDQPLTTRAQAAVQSAQQGIVSPDKPAAVQPSLGGPLDGMSLHVLGKIEGAGRYIYLVLSSVNGQPLKTFPHTELISAGYKVEPVSDLIFRLSYGNNSRFIVADAPQVNIQTTASPGQSQEAVGGHPRPARGVPADSDKPI